MADEPNANADAQGSAQAASQEDRATALQAAKELLLSEGLHVLSGDKFHGLKQDAAKPFAEKAQTLEQQLADAQSQLDKFREEQEARDNEGKSQAEVLRAELEKRQRAWESRDNERKAQLEALLAEKQALNEAHRARMREDQLRKLIAGNGAPRPIDLDVALTWAEKNLPGLSTGDSGELIYTEPTGVQHEGPAAEKIVRDWWAQQETLHAARPAGPATGGSPVPPTRTVTEWMPDPTKTPEENYREAMRAQQAARNTRARG